MFSINKNEGVCEILNSLKIKDIAFTFTMSKKDYYVCTCGHCHKIDDKRKENFVCPNCGNTYVVTDIDLIHDTIPLVYKPEVVRDDELFYILNISALALTFIDNDCCLDELQDDWNCFCYDKKKQKFFAIEFEYRFHNIEDCDSFEYRGSDIFSGDEKVGEIKKPFDILDWGCLYYGYPHMKNLFDINGMRDCLYMLANAVGFDIDKYVNDDTKRQFDDVIDALYMNNIKWQSDFEKLSDKYEIKKFGVSLNNYVSDYSRLIDAGVDMDAVTFEEAFGFPVEKMVQISNVSTYCKAKQAMDIIKDYKLNEYEMKWLEEIPYDLWNSILVLVEKTNATIYEVIRHIHRGMTRGFSAKTIIDTDFEMIAKGYRELCNVTLPFTPKILRKWEFVKSGVMDAMQFDLIAKRPTLDNIMKTLNI